MQESIPFPNKKYKVILADPPWQYDDETCRGTCANHYNTMDIQSICNLPVKNISDDDCILFLWATYPKLKEALVCIEAWGFTYKTIAFQWIKTNKSHIGYFYGLGRWTRGNTEPCLLATKGKPKRMSDSIFQIIQAPISKHSQKPPDTYGKIEQLMGNVSRIELFARERRTGWDAWGNQLPTMTQQLLMPY